MAIDEQPMNVYWSGKRTETVNRSKINHKGSVATFSDLPDTNNQTGDMYSVTGLNGENYIWNGTEWDSLGTSDAAVVHKTGDETVSGIKFFSDGIAVGGNIRRSDSTGSLSVCGGNGGQASKGAKLTLYGAAYETEANRGVAILQAGDASNNFKQLIAKPDGTIAWNGDAIQTTSDGRIKTLLSAVPDEVLDAWEDVHWGQFQFLDSVAIKGENARYHIGLIAQKIKEVFESHGLDACKYGILCHEEQPATNDLEAVDLWMIRYTEAQAMEAAYQRRRADRLEARIEAIEENLK